jgi:hypothetical protein
MTAGSEGIGNGRPGGHMGAEGDLTRAGPPEPGDAATLDHGTRARLEEIGYDPAAVEARLSELAEEWDIERVLEVNTLATSLIGSGIGLLRKRRLLAIGLPAAVAAFVLQHAIRGARPPETLLRRFGFRRRAEIEGERLALLTLRGGPFDPPMKRPGLAGAIMRTGRLRLRR